MNEVDFFNKAVDKTADDIRDFWANTFYPMECSFCNIIRDWFTNKLGGEYDADNPFECDIKIIPEFSHEDYPLNPCVVGVWYDQESDEVFFYEDILGDYHKDLSEYSISELVQIVQGFKEYIEGDE